MELYKFVRDRELKQNHNLTYYTGDLDEITSKTEVFGGITTPSNMFKSIFTIGFKGTRIWFRKKTNKVDSSHIIEGDQFPRMVYVVYKLGQPLHGTKKTLEEPIEEQLSMIERLFTRRRKYPRFHHKMVHHQFMFYACIELDGSSSYKWPDVFIIGENNVYLNSLDHDLELWRCLVPNSKIIVKNSNAYLTFQNIPTQFSKEKIMLFAYLNSFRKFECEGCTHEWTLSEYWELLECKKLYNTYRKHGIDILINDNGFRLQTKYKSCGLWIYYFPQDVFLQKCNRQVDRTANFNLLRWLLS